MSKSAQFSETVLLKGHIIDSLTFSKVLDRIMEDGARFHHSGHSRRTAKI